MEQEKVVKTKRYTIREARKRLTKLKRTEAALCIGVSTDTLARWEQGACLPNAKYLDAICRTYGIYRGQLILKTREDFRKENKEYGNE